MAELEIITMGRVSVDLYPEQIGVPLAEVKTFAKSLGGSATNVAVAAARLGHRSAVITKVGDDGFGPYVRAALEQFGVDARWVGTDPDLRTPLAFCEIFPPDDFPLLFYRKPKETEYWYCEALRHVTVAVGNQEEVKMAVGTGDPLDASEALLDLGIELAIV